MKPDAGGLCGMPRAPNEARGRAARIGATERLRREADHDPSHSREPVFDKPFPATCFEDDVGFPEEPVAGGGLRFSALLLALLMLIPSAITAMPGEAKAADQGHTLYYMTTNYEFLPVEGVKYTKVGIIPYTKEVCAVTTTGVVWTVGNLESPPTESPNYIPTECASPSSEPYLISMHSGTWSGSFSSTQSVFVSIDETGQAWSKFSGETPTPILSDIRFIDGATRSGLGANSDCGVLLGDPKPSVSTPTVSQVPTTGAPASSLTIPAALVAAGMLGAAVIVRRRRS